MHTGWVACGVLAFLRVRQLRIPARPCARRRPPPPPPPPSLPLPLHPDTKNTAAGPSPAAAEHKTIRRLLGRGGPGAGGGSFSFSSGSAVANTGSGGTFKGSVATGPGGEATAAGSVNGQRFGVSCQGAGCSKSVTGTAAASVAGGGGGGEGGGGGLVVGGGSVLLLGGGMTGSIAP